MTDPRPAPYPADTRAKGWRFELDLERIAQSDTWALAQPEVRPWLLMLWAVAWQQTPCGSLPADDALVAARLGMPAKSFAKHRAILLRQWWLAEDGRLYHDTVAAQVIAMLDTRGVDRSRQDARRVMFERIRDRDGRACIYCGHTKYLTLDHLVPLSRGGTNDEDNLAMACRPCNSRKGARTPDEAGMPMINQIAADRWRKYKNSAGEIRSKSEAPGTKPSDDTGTGTGTELKGIQAHASLVGCASAREGPEDAKPGPPADDLVAAMERAGLDGTKINAHNPRALSLLAQGATVAEFEGLAREAVSKQVKWPWLWVLKVLPERRAEAAGTVLSPPPSVTVASDAAEKTLQLIRSQQLTPQQYEASLEAKRRVFGKPKESA